MQPSAAVSGYRATINRANSQPPAPSPQSPNTKAFPGSPPTMASFFQKTSRNATQPRWMRQNEARHMGGVRFDISARPLIHPRGADFADSQRIKDGRCIPQTNRRGPASCHKSKHALHLTWHHTC
jgi:hypothetical protein